MKRTLFLIGLIAVTAAQASAQMIPRDLTKGNTLYVVPYAHLDTQWRWAYPQVIREFVPNTLYKNFALIDKYPHYVFNFSGSRRYQFMKDYYPAEFERLRGYVKAGRWFTAGSSVDEGDANVPSAESLIRHVLYGNNFFRREFGTASEEFMLPDCFGFPYALPSVLAHCGIKGFSTQKLTWGSAVGIPFKVGRWIGPDGRSVVAALDPGSYSASVTEDLSENTSWLARIQNTGKQSGAYVDYHYYGTGDIGGGPQDDAVAWVEQSIAGKGPVTVVSSHSDEMFKSLRPEQIAKLPTYQGELLLTQHSAGSISSQAYMKRWNRKNELLADAAEKASVGAMWLRAAPYPWERLYNAWNLVLGSQMHDMLPGTSIPKAYEFCWNDELLALNQFAAVETDAVGAVTGAMDTRAEGTSVVVYNPLSIAREDVVEAFVPRDRGTDVQVFGSDGYRVPTQVIDDGSSAAVKVLFLARAPSCGFATYDLRLGVKPQRAGELSVNGKTIENARFRVTVNEDGDFASIYDKANGREVLKAPARLAFQYHNPSAFPAWNMDWEDAQRPPAAYVHGPAKITVVEDGPVRVALQVERETMGSKFVQQIRLSAGDAGDRVEVLNKIDWQTREHALKASFPLTTGNPRATYDLQVGAIQRGNNDEKKYEVPQHQWLDLSKPDDSYGVGILNDSKYGSDKPDDDTVRLTLIYTPGVRGGYGDQATQDIGRHEILYAIAPHKGDWRAVPWTARRLNQPLRAYFTPSHQGVLGHEFSLVSTNSSQVEISAMKKSESGGAVIIRLRELSGQPARGVRVRFSWTSKNAHEVDGQEREIGTANVRSSHGEGFYQGSELLTDVPAYSLRAFSITPAAAFSPGQGAPISKPMDLPYDSDVASSDRNPKDGAFDEANQSLAAEQLPRKLALGGIEFKLGPTADGAKNAVTARGQTLDLPEGYSYVYVIAAASHGTEAAEFEVSPAGFLTSTRELALRYSLRVPAWDGYIGQWDNRLWNADVGENFTNYTEWQGLVPGYVKDSEVAWFCNHMHSATGNEFYQYSYLYKCGFGLPPGSKRIRLPDDPRVKILAISVAKNTHDDVHPAAPLYDQLTDHYGVGLPSMTPASGDFTDATAVTLNPPLYWRKGGLHYTTDGSDPSASSPAYDGLIMVYEPTTLKVAEVENGKVGPIATATLNVRDTTAPKVVAASSAKVLGVARVQFSERVDRASATDPNSYAFSSGAKAATVALSPDGKAVEITLDRALEPGQAETLAVTGVKDLAPRGNAVTGQTIELAERGAVFTSPPLEPKTSREFKPVEGLPVGANEPWTLNLFCKPDVKPEPLTLIAGFGRAIDGRNGTGRYFSNFQNGINFWICNMDVSTDVQLDIGKWQMLTATWDGATIRLYKNGEMIAEAADALSDDRNQVEIMPLDAWERKRIFPGAVRDMTIWNEALSPTAIKRLMEAAPK
ncbi:MAG: alpha-mannosidase [Fimbriimonadaceae bacterium]|nr:alpha-mannosidase [Fimbriimonadaceae bacterium]